MAQIVTTIYWRCPLHDQTWLYRFNFETQFHNTEQTEWTGLIYILRLMKVVTTSFSFKSFCFLLSLSLYSRDLSKWRGIWSLNYHTLPIGPLFACCCSQCLLVVTSAEVLPFHLFLGNACLLLFLWMSKEFCKLL